MMMTGAGPSPHAPHKAENLVSWGPPSRLLAVPPRPRQSSAPAPLPARAHQRVCKGELLSICGPHRTTPPPPRPPPLRHSRHRSPLTRTADTTPCAHTRARASRPRSTRRHTRGRGGTCRRGGRSPPRRARACTHSPPPAGAHTPRRARTPHTPPPDTRGTRTAGGACSTRRCHSRHHERRARPAGRPANTATAARRGPSAACRTPPLTAGSGPTRHTRRRRSGTRRPPPAAATRR